MIKLPATILASLLLLAPGARAVDGDFAKTLTPEESKSAGLPKLTPEEFARLEALVERYKNGQMAVAQKTVEPAQKAVEAHRAEPAKPTKKLMPDWVGALITLQRTTNKPASAEALESSIQGEFSGWSTRTVFKLENGQQWIEVNNESYVHLPALHSPKVKIFPAAFGSFWLDIEGVNLRCRVKPVKLE